MLHLNQNEFQEGLQLAQLGKIDEAYNIFCLFSDKKSPTTQYTALVNMATLKFQKGSPEEALTFLNQAVSIDPYSYLAYYNKFVIYYTQAYFQTRPQKKVEAYKSLICCLSCLHSQMAGDLVSTSSLDKQQQVHQNIKKSLGFCENNAMSYIIRGRMYELMNKIKLAENDYDTAQDYNKKYGMIYLMRSQFYWRRIQRENQSSKKKLLREKMQKDIQEYYQITKQCQSFWMGQDLEPSEQMIQEIENIDITQILKLYEEFSVLLAQNKKMKEISAQSLKNKGQESQHSSVNHSSGAFEDSSKNITAQIQRIQNEIKKEGGKVDTSLNAQSMEKQETFLTAEIQKVVNDIQQFKKQSEISSPKQKKLNDALSSNSSYSSKTIQRIISMGQLQQFNYAHIEIVSAQIFQQGKPSSRSGSIVLKYNNKNNEQKVIKTSGKSQYLWHQSFQVPIQEVSQANNEENQIKVGVCFELAPRSIWGSKVQIGIGTINLLEMGQNQCILQKNEKKTGVVYYKLKLTE